MWDQLDATISDFIVKQLFLNMFRAPLCPSSGGQTAFSLHMFICPVKWNPYELLWGRIVLCNRSYGFSFTGQITICSENAVWSPDDGCKDARNMLRNNWLTTKSLIVASSWFHIYKGCSESKERLRIQPAQLFHCTRLVIWCVQ